MKAQRTGASFFGFFFVSVCVLLFKHKLSEGYEIWSYLKPSGSEYRGTNKQMKSDEGLN